MFSDAEIAQYVLSYLARKYDTLSADYLTCFESFVNAPADDLELIELVIAKVRLNLISEVEADIMKLYRDTPAPKDKDQTSQKK